MEGRALSKSPIQLLTGIIDSFYGNRAQDYGNRIVSEEHIENPCIKSEPDSPEVIG